MKRNFTGKVMFLTFTADATAFGERACDFLIHVKQQRSLGHALRLLKRWGWAGESCRVAEFQGNGMIHWHVIVDGVRGYIPHAVMMAAWNRPRNRPAWAGEPGVFEEGKRAGETRPLVGFVQFERPDWGPGPDGKLLSPVIRYVCGYMAKAGKNGHPQYFEDYCDGKIDGKRHNAQVFSSSRRFFDGVRVQRVRRLPSGPRRRYKRRTVRERLLDCRCSADLMRRIEVLDRGEIIETRYEYLGTFGGRSTDGSGSLGYTACVYALWPRPVAEKISSKRGCWLAEDDVRWLAQSREFMASFSGRHGVGRVPGGRRDSGVLIMEDV